MSTKPEYADSTMDMSLNDFLDLAGDAVESEYEPFPADTQIVREIVFDGPEQFEDFCRKLVREARDRAEWLDEGPVPPISNPFDYQIAMAMREAVTDQLRNPRLPESKAVEYRSVLTELQERIVTFEES